MGRASASVQSQKPDFDLCSDAVYPTRNQSAALRLGRMGLWGHLSIGGTRDEALASRQHNCDSISKLPDFARRRTGRPFLVLLAI